MVNYFRAHGIRSFRVAKKLKLYIAKNCLCRSEDNFDAFYTEEEQAKSDLGVCITVIFMMVVVIVVISIKIAFYDKKTYPGVFGINSTITDIEGDGG